MLQTLSTRVVMIPVSMITGILMARYLGPSDRGLLALFLLVPHTIKMFSTLGLDTASIYLHRKEKVPFGPLLANCLVFGIVLGTVVAGGVWVGREHLPIESLENAGPLLLVSLAAVPLALLYQYLGGLARAVDRYALSNSRSVIEKVLDAGSVILIVFVFRGGVFEYLVMQVAILTAVVAWLCWDLRAHIEGKLLPDLHILGRMLRFGIKSYAQGIASHIHYRADLYLVAAFLSRADIAFYAIGAGLAERCLMFADVMGTVLFPKLASADKRQGALLAARVCRNTLFLGCFMAIAVCLSGRLLVGGLYGRDYLPAVTPMYFLIAGVLMVGITRILMRYLTSLNVHQHNVYLVGTSAIVNIGLNIWLIPRLGIVGAAISSLCTYTLQGVWVLYLFSRFSGLPVTAALILSREDVKYLRRLPSRLRLRQFAPAIR